MDVRFYLQTAPANISTDTPCLGPSPCLDPYYSNKGLKNWSMARQWRNMPGSACYIHHMFDGENMFMSMTDPSQDCMPGSQSYPVPNIGDEDLDIPPITPPTMPDHSLLHLADAESSYHSMCHSMPQNGLLQFNPQSMNLPAITVSNMLNQDGSLLSNCLSVANQRKHNGPNFDSLCSTGTGFRPSIHPSAFSVVSSHWRPGTHLFQMHDLGNTETTHYSAHPQMSIMRSAIRSTDIRHLGAMQRGQLTTINQSQLSAQLGLNMGGNAVQHSSPSPPGSKSATPSPSSSVHEDETDETSKMNGGEKRAAVDVGKKPKTPKKKKKKDPNEPQKPVSAYALFFRDTQAAIKGQNPNATFGEVSKIVASMWDGLGEEQKQVYKKKTEAAKKEYLKQLAAYRASLVSKSYNDPIDTKTSQASQMMNSKQPVFSGHSQAPSPMYLGSGAYHQQPGMNPHMSTMHPNLSRSIAPKPNGQMPVTVSIANMTVSPPPSLQISPPLHQLSMQQHQLHQQQTSVMSQQIGNHQLSMQVQAPLHSPTMQQGFLQSEFQNIINSTSTAAPVATPTMDCVRSVCRNPPPQSVDWNDYCNNGLQRDKTLYLT
ncbi:thymocyte selection-associated high mobility group box protein TOX isoform X2 [Scyliorhinus canicula]|uniref:thymocyte selection-associated high mobility group box protein TOX isoform X2 n=1 Tax=Scyliorhinus canicula TaxID=7830 RepID=UPI0018F46D98|nr:thymocyte selection-associated high mobility group box protein TOX isoform X2 [Scyliorhinus canicula]